MIIPINIASSSASNPKLPPGLAKISHDEVVLIELQGSLEVEHTHISDRDGKYVGKLKIDPLTNQPTLLIGHHLLEGKITNLSKPLAVLLRSRTTSAVADSGHSAAVGDDSTITLEDKDGDDGDDVEMTDLDDRSQKPEIKSTEWDVVAVVKRKIVFAKRPMPVVNLGR